MAGLLDIGTLLGYIDRAKRNVSTSAERIRSQGLLSALNTEGADAMSQIAANPVAARQQIVEQSPGLLAPIVYHGSPYKFDKFDASKIGTGEGAQAYGHGMYLADRRGTAGSYAANLSERYDPRGEVNALFFTVKTRQELMQAVKDSPVLGPLVKQEPQFLKDILEYHAGQNADGTVTDAALRAARRLDAQLPKTNSNIYTVDLPDEWVPKMLDWDKPLSQQPQAVRNALDKIPNKRTYLDGKTNSVVTEDLPYTKQDAPWPLKEFYGESAYRDIAQRLTNNDVEASKFLSDLGIPGIRYLDQGSRGAGEGTYNYVVFPGYEHLLKILSRE